MKDLGVPFSVIVIVIMMIAWAGFLSPQRTLQSSSLAYERTKLWYPVGGIREGRYTDPKSFREEVRTERELRAQEEVARWAFWAFAVSILALATTAVGAVFVWQNLRVVQDTARRELRAYIGIEKIALKIPDWNYDASQPRIPGSVSPNRVVFTLQNFGQTPALDLHVFAYPGHGSPTSLVTEAALRGTEPQDARFDPNFRVILSKVFLQSGSRIDIPVEQRDLQVWKAAETYEKRIFLYGRIYYRDIYGADWRQYFCYIYNPHEYPIFTPYEWYNGEDRHPPPPTAPF